MGRLRAALDETTTEGKFAAELRRQMERVGIALGVDLCEMLNIRREPKGLKPLTRKAVEGWVAGRNTPTLANFIELALVLEIKPSDLMKSLDPEE